MRLTPSLYACRLGVYDPLNLLAEPVEYPRRSYRRYVELEIKHGRIAMLATLGVITTEAGIRWPGYISKTLDLKFEDIPGGALDSWAAVPALGWLQIVSFVIFLELAYGQQDPKKEPGDVGGVSWIRYDDPEVKKFKLNVRVAFACLCDDEGGRGVAACERTTDAACLRSVFVPSSCDVGDALCSPPRVSRAQAERNNGRAAMMGIFGMMTHNALGVDSLFPIVQ